VNYYLLHTTYPTEIHFIHITFITNHICLNMYFIMVLVSTASFFSPVVLHHFMYQLFSLALPTVSIKKWQLLSDGFSIPMLAHKKTSCALYIGCAQTHFLESLDWKHLQCKHLQISNPIIRITIQIRYRDCKLCSIVLNIWSLIC